MFRFIIPTILIGMAIAGFIMIVSPFYKDVSLLQAQVDSYNKALDNSKLLENERDKLTKKYNSIDPKNLDKIQKLLPNNVDNIRLILEIEKIASPYGMVLKDVRYDISSSQNEVKTDALVGGQTANLVNKEYGTWDLEFSVEGSYTNFLSFIKDLEDNLRIVDISSIQFSSIESGSKSSSSESYKYSFRIKTYWMKN